MVTLGLGVGVKMGWGGRCKESFVAIFKHVRPNGPGPYLLVNKKYEF